MADIKRILSVDDVKTNLKILDEILEDDYQLAHAESGKEALEKLDSFSPDLVLLDIMMPDINGLEICQKIKSSDKWKDIKVILVTGRAMPEEREAGLAAGADNYLTKPFSIDEILAAIQAL